jgi:hypothetical protein
MVVTLSREDVYDIVRQAVEKRGRRKVVCMSFHADGSIELTLSDRVEPKAGVDTGNLITHDGRTMSLREWWSKEAAPGISYQTLHARLHRDGWSMEAALTIPPLAPGQRRHGHARLRKEA